MQRGTDGRAACPLRLADAITLDRNHGLEPSRKVEINSKLPFDIESDDFKGHLLFFVKGLPSAPAHIFNDHKRKTHLIVQGIFKRPVTFDDAVTGQRFTRPLKQLPSVLMLVFMLGRRLSPSLEIGCPKAPSILSPLVSTAQVINVARHVNAKPIDSEPVEDMRELGITCRDGRTPLPAAERKRFFAKAKNRKGCHFTTDHTYTFHFWQHMLDCANFQLDLGFATYDLVKHLDGQPLQLMAQCKTDGRWLWRLYLEHDRQGNV